MQVGFLITVGSYFRYPVTLIDVYGIDPTAKAKVCFKYVYAYTIVPMHIILF